MYPAIVALLLVHTGAARAAELPDGLQARWGEEPVDTLSNARARICLNGLWQFVPSAGPVSRAPEGDRGWIWVPGSWKGVSCLPGIAAPGAGVPWDGLELATLGRAWFERPIRVPADWAGRAVLLDLQRVSTSAVVFVNGSECGRVAWPGGIVDLTDAVQPGGEDALRVFVAAAQDEAGAAALREGQDAQSAANLEARGLAGDVLLLSRPRGPHISDVFVMPSVREKRLTLRVDFGGRGQAGPVQLTARLLDEQGQEEQRFTATVQVGAGPVEVGWPWADPRLWDVGQPNLYTLQLAADGNGVQDEYVQEFGFREFRIDGRRFLLNEREVRLRPINVGDQWNRYAWTPEAIAGMLDGYSWAGFNLGEQWPWDANEPGLVEFRDLWLDAADRKGFLMTGVAPNMAPYIHDPGWVYAWDKPGRKDAYRQRVAAELRRLRNHPSCVMWGTTANFFGRVQDQNPRLIGRRDWIRDEGWQRLAAAGQEGIDSIKAEDPTRPVFTHHGAYVGDVHTCNNYLCLTPLQEREEWLSQYVRDAELPYLPIEFGTPLHATFMRGRDGFGGSIVSEPLMTEFCAIYLGAEAYRMEPQAYRDRIVWSFEGGQRFRNWHNPPEMDGAPAFQAVQSLFIRNTWRSWRTWGIEGGMVPWSLAHGWDRPQGRYYEPVPVAFEPGRRGPYFPSVERGALEHLRPEGGSLVRPSAEALREVNGATLAWIAGPPEAFTAKDHHFVSEQTFRKQVVLINDAREGLPYEFRWQTAVNGEETGAGDGTGHIGSATTVRLPLDVICPRTTVKARGEIRLTAKIGEHRHEDRFAFTVFPTHPEERPVTRVLAFDPEGETTQLLRALGVAAELWDGELAPGRTLVVGRHALDGTATLPGSLQEFVRTGGRAVVFAQDPDWLRRAMGFRVARHVSRRCFPLAAPSAHPVVAGLDAEDFRDWNGAGTLVPETWGGLEDDPDRDPRYGWHWGNRGSVSSGAIEKPHHSGWRPILEAEFDQAYSPLMELRYGQGVALLCTLDLEARTGGDPVAERLAERIVTYAREAPLTPSRRQTVLLGGERGAGLLRESGLEFATSDRLPDPSALAVIGPEAAVADEALRSFLERGGHALLLPRPAGALPLGLRAAPTRTCGSLEVPAWPECEGLSASDLRLRAEIEAPLIAEAPVGEIGAGGMLARVPVGPGVAVFAQVRPELLATEERTYLRYSAWRVTRALTQLLANLGATFEMDAKSLDIGWHLAELPVPLAGEWRCKVEQTLPLAETPEGRHADPGVSPEAAGWAAADLDDSAWETHRLPGYFESWGPEWRMDGAVWFRRQVVLPAEWAGQSLTLRLGPVDDTDATYFNGELVGTNSGWNVSRTYRIPPALVRPGLNTIAVRAFDSYGGGGFAGPSEDLRLELPAPPPPAGLQMVKNADFARGLDAWTLGVFGDATAEALVVEDAPQPLVGARSVQLDVTATSAEGWHVMLLQTGLGVEQGRSYDLSFWAKADHPTQVSAQVTMNHPPHHPVGPTLTADLGTGWQEYRFAWRPDQSDDDVRLTLLGMCDETGRYQFAGLSLTAQELEASEEVAARPLGFYSRDYREDFELGDDPYRYYRW